MSQLRAKRRHLFRMYLRCLTDEFNTVYAALRLTMVSSEVDRAELAKILFTQRRLFYERLLGVQVRLALNAWGFDTVPSLELIRQLEVLRQECYRLSPAT